MFNPSGVSAPSPDPVAINWFGDGIRLNICCMKGILEMEVRKPDGSRYVLQLGTGAPLNVQLPNKSIAESGPVAPEGRTGLPLKSTDGLAALAFCGSTPGQYRKIPAFAMSVSVRPYA